MDDKFDYFLEDFDDCLESVNSSNYETFESNVRDLISVVDENAKSKEYLASLLVDFDFEYWWKEGLGSKSGMVGSGNLKWSDKREIKMAQQIALVRYFGENKDGYINFIHSFMYVDGNFDSYVSEINEQLVEPAFREFRKRLIRIGNVLQEEMESNVPASDRIVSINHNSSEVIDLIRSLNSIETHIVESNIFLIDDIEEKKRAVAEIQASKSILQANKARATMAFALIAGLLAWLAKEAAGSVIGELAVEALPLLKVILGM